MTIAIISVIHEPWGGSEALWAAMAENALQNGHHIIYCTLAFKKQSHQVQKLESKGLQLISRRGYVPNGEPTLRRQSKKVWLMVRNVFSNPFQPLFDSKPDVIIYNGTTFSLLEHLQLLKLWNKFSGRKIILAHFLPENNAVLNYDTRKLMQSFFLAANATLFVSQRSWQQTERALACQLSRHYIVRNPVNIVDTSIVDFPDDAQQYHMAMVGNLLCVHKGQDSMFQVLAQEHWKNQPWHLNIYGHGMDRKYLEDLAAMYELSSKITFHGRVDDIRKLWMQNHILLMPSVMEGMPLAVVEAMLCGRPVLATDVGGHMEWIEDNQHGFIAAASSVYALDEALHRAWSRKDDWQEMGAAAHRRAINLYDPKAGETLLKLITTIED